MGGTSKRSLFAVLSSLLLVFSQSSYSRDSRELRKYYTQTLRRHIYLSDKALIEIVRGSLSQNTHRKLKEGLKELTPKLQSARAKKLTELLEELPKGNIPDDLAKMRLYRKEMLESFRVVTSPAQTPELKVGIEVYRSQCAACHGESGLGDGRLAQNKKFPMIPGPTNLKELENQGDWSPFSYYNLLLTGVEGTSMQAFDVTLTDHERWSLAFYLAGAPFRKESPENWEPNKIAVNVEEWGYKSLNQLKNLEFLAKSSRLDLEEFVKANSKLDPKSASTADSILRFRRSQPFLK